ncbi:MAG: FtsX-like permease family protein [Pseudomonadota bacterium]
MKTLLFAWRSLLREIRGGEVLVLLAALSIAVASVTAIGFLTDRVAQAVRLQASEVLAGDIRVRAAEPLDPAWLERAEATGLATAESVSFVTVVYAGDESTLVRLQAVTPGYPLRGQLETADSLFGDGVKIRDIPPPGEVWAERAALARLGADVGAVLDVGERQLRVTRLLAYRPDQSTGFTSFAPTVLMNLDGLEATGLVREGSRVSYAQLFAGERAAVDSFAERLDGELAASIRVQTRGEASGSLTDAIDRASRFLALASLVSLVLAAVAVAMAARRYAERRLDTAALMKSLGASQSFVLNVSIIQLLLIAAIASVIGSALGFVSERVLVNLLGDLLRADLPSPSLFPIVLGVGTATVLLIGFALPCLLTLKSTPPLRVLRHDLVPAPPTALATYGSALAALGALVYWSVRDLALVAIILGGSALAGIVLYVGGRLLTGALGSLRSTVGVSWRYGLANVARRGSLSAVQVVAFGLGLMVLLFLTFVRTDLLSSWRATLGEDVPNRFVINIQPEEVDSVRTILTDAGIDARGLTPLVRARMIRINGEDVRERSFRDAEARGFASREANLTYTNTLSATNAITAGEWWGEDYAGDAVLVSVDEDIAVQLGLSLGDTLTFMIAGVEIDATISNYRRIQWDSFEPNFFMVLSGGALDPFPRTYITALRVDDAKRNAMLDLARQHPSVSVIDTGAIIEQVRGIIDRASLAVQAVFLFTLGAGLVVLFAAVQTTLNERRYESALLRTFGARSGTVFAGVAAEFLAIGLAAGLLAALGASALGWVAARELFQLSYGFDPGLWLAGFLGGAAVVGLSGIVAARSAVTTPPVRVLRAG